MSLTTRQNTKFRNAINNNLATDLKLSKAQIKKLIQSGGFLGKLLSKLADPLMKVALPLAKNVLAPLGLTAAMSAIDGSIQKKIHGSGVKLIIEQEDMKDIMKITEVLENSSILLKGVSKTIENETKEQRGGFLSTLLGTLGASLLGNLLTGGKGIMRAIITIIKKFNKRKVYSQFKDNIWGVDLAEMQSLSRKNKGIKYLLCAIDLYSKYAFVIPLKDKKGISIVNVFNKIIKESGKKNK